MCNFKWMGLGKHMAMLCFSYRYFSFLKLHGGGNFILAI